MNGDDTNTDNDVTLSPLIKLYNASSPSSLVEWVVKEFGIAHIEESSNKHAANKHKARREEMEERVRLYRDDAAEHISLIIRQIWTRPDYQQSLERWIGVEGGKNNLRPVGTAENVSVRIVHEVACLYDKPAVRRLPKAGAQTNFKLDEARLHLHEITQDYHRLLWLCNDILVWQFKGVDGKNKLRVVTPNLFDVVPHPDDCTVMAGVLIEVPRITMLDNETAKKLPRWELWDDTYRYLINAGGKLVDEDGNPALDGEKHDLGRIPGALLHRREPSDRALDARAGRDIAAAHRGVTLLNILMLRLAKTQGDKQPILTGDLASVSKGQTADGENPLALPPGVTVEMLNSVTDPGHLQKTKKEMLSSVGWTYGLSYEQQSVEETTANAGTAKLWLARREKLLELRTEQTRRALVNEALVLDLIGYDPTGLKVDHPSQALPQDPTEEMALLDLQMRVGMDSPVKALQRRDPDLTRDEAVSLMDENLGDWALMIQKVRALNIPLGATAANPGNDPQINGSNKVVEKMGFGDLDGSAPAPGQPGQQPQQGGAQPPRP